ncbi:hypothetical protein [Noviluteimonas dokdonensis]|nr:hypothetical protein [Lysobacter dokdonensis]
MKLPNQREYAHDAHSTTQRLETAIAENRSLRDSMGAWGPRLRASLAAYHQAVRRFQHPMDGLTLPPRVQPKADGAD